MTLPASRTIAFPCGATAAAIDARADASGDDLVAALGLAVPVATIVVNGSAGQLDRSLIDGLSAVVGRPGLAGLAESERFTVLTGGTDAGIFSIVGRAVPERSSPLVGVAPVDLVTWAAAYDDDGDADDDDDGERVPLEPHHTHFVLVDGDTWGAETAVLLSLARALGRMAPSVAVVCGGGPVTRNEVLGHVRDGRPVIVLAGSGRFADELVSAVRGNRPAADATVAEIVGDGHLTVCEVSSGAAALVASVRAALR